MPCHLSWDVPHLWLYFSSEAAEWKDVWSSWGWTCCKCCSVREQFNQFHLQTHIMLAFTLQRLKFSVWYFPAHHDIVNNAYIHKCLSGQGYFELFMEGQMSVYNDCTNTRVPYAVSPFWTDQHILRVNIQYEKSPIGFYCPAEWIINWTERFLNHKIYHRTDSKHFC